MFVKIENTGCCEKNQMLQVRFNTYLDSTDYGYDKTRAEVYERELTEAEMKDEKLANLVPKIWQTNPFHNHFVYLDPSLTDTEILNLGEALLKEAYGKWSMNSKIDLRNKPLIPAEKNDIKLIACKNRLIELKAVDLEQRV